MSIRNNQQMIFYLHQHGIPYTMINIIEEQRICDEDLRTIDRDDVEHLFKNEYGFSFGDRKQFWNLIQKLQPTDASLDFIYINDEDTSSVLSKVNSNQWSNSSSEIQQKPLSPTNIPSPNDIYYQCNEPTQLYQSVDGSLINFDRNVTAASTSFPSVDQPVQSYLSNTVPDFYFRSPVELPIFSDQVMKAFETNTIDSEWRKLTQELANWILTMKKGHLKKREYRVIGEALFEKYPGIDKIGFRPWSYLFKCLAPLLRRERYKRGFSRTRK